MWNAIEDFFAERPWVGEVLTAFAVLAVFWIGAVLVTRFCRKQIDKGTGAFGQKLLGFVVRPLRVIIFLVGLQVAVAQVTLSPRRAALRDGIFFTLTVLVGCYFAARIVDWLARWYIEKVAPVTQTTLDEEFLPLIDKLAKIAIFTIGGIIILENFGYDITALVATLGVASLAVALAARETLANMISGFTIMIDRPFRLGDRVQLDSGEIGDVYEMGLRSLKILTLDHMMVVIPNARVAGNKIINLSYPNPQIRLRLPVGVAYGTDLEKVEAALLEVAKEDSQVLDDPAPAVRFVNFGDSSLDLVLLVYIDSFTDQYDVTDRINRKIKLAFEAGDIEIPFPRRQVILEPWQEKPGKD